MEIDEMAPRALQEVWEWREKAQQSLIHLPTIAEKITEIQRRTRPLAEELRHAQQQLSLESQE